MSRQSLFQEYAVLLSCGIALEVSGYPKPGNVHRLKNYEDIWFEDFILTSIVAVPWILRAIKRGYGLALSRKYKYVIGDIVYNVLYNSMKLSGGGNTCLGSMLLLTPLALSIGYLFKTHMGKLDDPKDIATIATNIVKKYSTIYDAIEFYRAVRKASPKYIKLSDYTGKYPNVWDRRYKEKIIKYNYRLWDILLFSSSRDLVAREVIEEYSRSLNALRYFVNCLNGKGIFNECTVRTYLYILSNNIDTVIAREHGVNVAEYVSNRAKEILEHVGDRRFYNLLQDFDKELHEKKINPGAVADIVVSTLSLYCVIKKYRLIH